MSQLFANQACSRWHITKSAKFRMTVSGHVYLSLLTKQPISSHKRTSSRGGMRTSEDGQKPHANAFPITDRHTPAAAACHTARSSTPLPQKRHLCMRGAQSAPPCARPSHTTSPALAAALVARVVHDRQVGRDQRWLLRDAGGAHGAPSARPHGGVPAVEREPLLVQPLLAAPQQARLQPLSTWRFRAQGRRVL